IAAPTIMIRLAPKRSISHPIAGLLTPAASGAVDTNREKNARLHPKCFTTGRKNTLLAFMGPQIRNKVVKRAAINRAPDLSSRRFAGFCGAIALIPISSLLAKCQSATYVTDLPLVYRSMFTGVVQI